MKTEEYINAKIEIDHSNLITFYMNSQAEPEVLLSSVAEPEPPGAGADFFLVGAGSRSRLSGSGCIF